MNRFRRRTAARRAFLAGSAAIFGGAMLPVPLRAVQFSWKYGSPFTASYTLNVRMVEACNAIRKESKGALDIQPFLNSSLGTPTAMIDQLRFGALEIFCNSGGAVEGLVPVGAIENVAYAFATRQTAFAAMDGDLGTLIRAQYPAKGLIALERCSENGVRNFTTSTRPIRTVDDLQGMRMRISPGKLHVDTFASMGASPVAVSANEVYTALQTKVVDGEETPLLFIEDLRFYEVQKYCSLSRHVWSGYWTFISKKQWDLLPPDLQGLIRTYMNKAAVQQRKDNQSIEESVHDKLRRQGLIFNDVAIDTIKNRLRSSGYYSRWRTEFGDTAWKTLEKYTGPLT